MRKIIKNGSLLILIVITLVAGYLLLKKSPTILSQTVALQKVDKTPILAANGSSGNIGGNFEVNTDNLQKIESGDSSYWRVIVEERQLYCAAKGAHLSGKGKTKEEVEEITKSWNNKESKCSEPSNVPWDSSGKIKSRPYYYLREKKQASYAEAFILTYPDPDWNSWSAIKQEAIWATPRLNKNKRAPKATGNGTTASQLALQAAYYEQFARKIENNNGTMNPKNTTKEDNVRVSVDTKKQEYIIGPFSMTYVNGNYGMVFGGVSDMYVVGEETDCIEIESFIVKDSKGKFTKTITPRYFTPMDDKNLVDTGAQNYPASGQEFYIKIKAPKDLHVEKIHVEFKWMKAEATLYYFDAYKYVGVFTHNHTAHCHGHRGVDGKSYTCSGCCFDCKITTEYRKERVSYQDQLESDGRRWLEQTSLDIKIPGDKNLTIKLAGNVWEDAKGGKETKPNGIKNDEEKMLPGVEVILHEASTNMEVARTVTDTNGHYEFNYIDSKKKYYIEFVYNGQMYQPTYYEDNLSGGYSNATDIILQREQYNLDYEQIGSYPENYKVRRKLYYEVGNHNVAYNILKYSNASGNTYTQNANERSEYGIKEIYEYVINEAASTKSYEKAYKNALNKFGNTEETRRKLQFIEDNRISSFTGNDTQRKIYPIYDRYTIGYETKVIEKIEYPALYPEHLQIDFGLTRREVADVALMNEIEKATIEIKGREETYYYKKRATDEQINQEGDNTIWDISVRLSDAAYYNTQYSREIYKSDYIYKVEEYAQNNSLTQEQIKEKYGETQDRELEVYVTYKVMVKNQSQSIKTKINEVVDYYDSEYEYVDDRSYIEIKYGNNKGTYPVKANNQSIYSENTKTNIEGYNNLYITGLDGIYLSTGETANIYLTFKVKKNPERFIYLDENDVGKQNIAEINGYSTNYAKDTEIPNIGTTADTNKVAGILDIDSVPGNLSKPIEQAHFEDDTDKAINLRVILEKDNRTIDGIAWEDNRTEYNKEQATVTGNGIKEEKETAIDGVKVQLVELLDNGSEYIWKEFLTGQGTYEPIINSNNMISNITDNTKGKYVFTSFVPGNYIVRFVYGDNDETVLTSTKTDVTNTLETVGKNEKSYNGQDYKTTVYQAGIAQDRTYYSEFLDKEISGYKDYTNQNETGTYLYDINQIDGKNISAAKDIASRRQETMRYSSNNITNEMAEILASYKNVPEGTTKEILRSQIEKFKEYTYMKAETGNINVEVEKDKTEVNNQTGNNELEYNVTNVNLGLEERPKAQIAITKQVDNVKVILADGSTLFDAKGTSTNVLWLKNINYEPVYKNGLLTEIRNANAKKSGLIQLSMDEELMHGATIQITYKIVATNVGETDYNDNKFYYTGIVSDISKVAKTTVNQVIDYVANNLQFDSSLAQNANWKAISKEELINQKLVNARLTDKLGTFNTIITITDNSNISKTPLVPEIYAKQNGGNSSAEDTLYLTQSITPENSTSDLTYENIIEVVKTSNTVGRKNEYSIVGNQDPTVSPSEVDSDMAEVVKILPPFGLTQMYITIAAITLVGTTILIAGIIFIRKKVLNNAK